MTWLRDIAKQKGHETYQGDECVICGGTAKVTATGGCHCCTTSHLDNHSLMLLVIRSPGKTESWYARYAGVSISRIKNVLGRLNVPRRKQPEHYIG